MRSCWNLKLSDLLFFGLLLTGIPASAQFSQDKTILPATGISNYLFPINPGRTAILTGTMGELRNTHFHAGLDIDTPGIGAQVLCAQDGYISYASVTTGGYGNVLFVTHPDGNTTVYAHLEEFKGAVGEYIRKERYTRKVSEISLEFSPGQFPVSRGDLLALSGNTGGSGGPHLHFEVRNKNNEAINPLTFDFGEVNDHTAPFVFKIALKTLDDQSRINDQFGRFEFSVVKKGDTYSLPHPILASGHIGVEVLAHDKMENSRFRYGINYIDLKVDNEKAFTQKIDKVNFNEYRRILTLMDYKILELKGARYNKLYIDDGNKLDYYPGVAHKNGITIRDQEINVDVDLKDFNGNTSKVHFVLKPGAPVKNTPLLSPMSKPYELEVQENTLKTTVKYCVSKDSVVNLWQGGNVTKLLPAYQGSNQLTYLINLKKVLPDSMVTCQGTIKFNFKDRIPSETDYTYYGEMADINFPDQALYDTTYLTMTYDTLQQRELFTIGSPTTPLHKAIYVTLKPKLNYFQSRDLGLYRREGKGYSYVSSEWKNNRIRFYTRDFGQFTLLRDTTPPVITKISTSTAAVRFKIRDNLSGIAYFEASINGQWLLMNYDYKTGILKSEKSDATKLLQGEFELKVVDQAGNESIFKQKI